MASKKRALIIGCGIAGPAAALCLRRAGCEPIIFEASPEPDDYAGLFLNVARNGMRILADLGVDGFVRKQGMEMRIMRFRNAKGNWLGDVGRPTCEPQGYTIKRSLLHRALREEVQRQGISLHFGKKLAAIHVLPDQVTALFQDGTSETGDFLVGCDGLHSQVRKILFPDALPPVYTGLISFGGYSFGSQVAYEPGVQHLFFGKKAFFGYAVNQSGEVYWFGNIRYPGKPTRRELASPARQKVADTTRHLVTDSAVMRLVTDATTTMLAVPLRNGLRGAEALYRVMMFPIGTFRRGLVKVCSLLHHLYA